MNEEPELQYVKGGPEPGGKVMIYGELVREGLENKVYLAINAQNIVMNIEDMIPPFMRKIPGLEELIKSGFEEKNFVASKVTPRIFNDDSFIEEYDGDVISVGKVKSESEASSLINNVLIAYIRRFVSNFSDKRKTTESGKKVEVLPRLEKHYSDIKSEEELEGLLTRKIESYSGCLSQGDNESASEISLQLRLFAENTPISAQVEAMLRNARSNHKEKDNIQRLLVKECGAIYRENYELAARIRDQIRNLQNLK
ncbi:hypothetical protein D6745_00465 [Candidatus Woesearchaeota archaeon]|nr:MAG: hypothetical protein D6745_00465 [Candidatus Woesearchaeota archaeon]